MNAILYLAFSVGLCHIWSNHRLLYVAMGIVSIVLGWTLTPQLIIWWCKYDGAIIINMPASWAPQRPTHTLTTVLLLPSVLLFFNHTSNQKPEDHQCVTFALFVLPKSNFFCNLGGTLKTAPAVNCSKWYAQLARLWQTGDTVAMALRCPSAAAGLWDLVKMYGGQ